MLEHLGKSLRERRRKERVKLVRVGAALDKSEAALSRFESGHTWPNDLDAAIEAYAHELGATPLELWAAAIKRWRDAERPGALERELEAGGRSPRKEAEQTEGASHATGRKR